ncbi:DUF1616 domain-containing protein [Natronorarus salvus]|uniref:DUF1616 domain-containing protein n=1 Tax=Natronorarus salvus TaxID=3117733 RepID=UPI002F26312B
MDRRNLRLLLPEPIRTLSADLAVVVVLTLLTVVVTTVPVIRETPIRILLGLPFLLFLPGYAFVAALFPEAGSPSGVDEEARTEDRGIDGIERIALAFGMSIALVPLLGLALNFTPWGIALGPILLAVSGLTLLCVAVAAKRRRALPPEERFTVPWRGWIAAGRTEMFEPDDRVDAALNVVVVLAVVLALASVGFAVAFPQSGEQFTEFYLLTEEDDGDLIAADYPEEFVQGETQSLVVGIENNEHESVEYTVVIQLERVDGEGNETEVVEREELDRFEESLAHNESVHRTQDVTPTMTGEELRLTFLLYDGEVPEEPTRENAYRDLHLWIDVEEV